MKPTDLAMALMELASFVGFLVAAVGAWLTEDYGISLGALTFAVSCLAMSLRTLIYGTRRN